MTEQTNIFRSPRSIAGSGLVGLGTFLLYEDLAGLLARLTQILGANGSKAWGTLPAAALSAWQVYGTDYPRFLQDLLVRILIASWPWLLVIVGTALTRTPSQSIPGGSQKKECGFVDPAPVRSTSK